jgi:hypothetical protein
MSDHDTRQGTTHKTDISEGGTATPTSGSPSGTGQKDPVMGSQDQEDDAGSAGDPGTVHGRLTGSNPEAPGYGSPSEDQGT